MNIPSIYRKITEGFVIPPRTFFQMTWSAFQGARLLFGEKHRNEFIQTLDKGIINENVIAQATAGPLVMLSLFYDLQNPLFKQNGFQPKEFLDGASIALERFHNVAGGLENQLNMISENSTTDESEEKETKDGKDDDDNGNGKAKKQTKDEVEEGLGSILSLFAANSGFGGDGGLSDPTGERLLSVLKFDWAEEAKKNPESLAGQLQRMLTPELFKTQEQMATTSFFLQKSNKAKNVTFNDGSCSVNNVALLSARAFRYVEKEQSEPENADNGENTDDDVVVVKAEGEGAKKIYEPAEYGPDDDGNGVTLRSGGGVVAQIEVLYDVTQEFTIDDKEGNTQSEGGGVSDDEQVKPSTGETKQTTVVSVATMEGWLQGGPDGELQWKLCLYRPAFEFPGIQQSY